MPNKFEKIIFQKVLENMKMILSENDSEALKRNHKLTEF